MQREATLPMEPAHRPRPFGCGLSVTVRSERTRAVVAPSPSGSLSGPDAMDCVTYPGSEQLISAVLS